MKAQNEDTTEVAVSLPDCCHPSEGASLPERLYCIYNASGPAERAGLAHNGKPCPTWGQLTAWAAEGKAGPAGVVAKWRGEAEALFDLDLGGGLTVRELATRALMHEAQRAWARLRETEGLLVRRAHQGAMSHPPSDYIAELQSLEARVAQLRAEAEAATERVNRIVPNTDVEWLGDRAEDLVALVERWAPVPPPAVEEVVDE